MHILFVGSCVRYCMVCASVLEDTLLPLESRLCRIQTYKPYKFCFIAPASIFVYCDIFDAKHWNKSE